MQRLAVTALLLLSLCADPHVLAAGRGPVCRETTVVDEITREIRAQDYYSSIDARLITEQATGDPRIVRCQVCVQSVPYDITRFGDRPLRQCLARDFEIRILANGFVVRDLR